ncbi:mitochondrial import receptor subunit Tom22 [Coemansia brasiliensis]|uniref:Mitochondrial import receptor subunit Tom22 n=1 Tax=Coemansia brasiliensis TaxID=2650707 RepID=A0A9W8IHS1_9FUNG|nr:mitochondrial import receptor subunit Tom22 [Coemansia brasiliensis]
MVKLVEIENEYESDSQYTTDSEVASQVESDYEDSDSEFEDDDILDESLLERLAALKEIVPAEHRQMMSRSISRISHWGEFGIKLVGKLSWVFTTSALLVVFPLALETDRDKMMQQWEQEQQKPGVPGQPQAPQMGPPAMGMAQGLPAPGLA